MAATGNLHATAAGSSERVLVDQGLLTIPKSLLQKIRNWEYVDLALLLLTSRRLKRSTFSICDSVTHLAADCPQNSRKFTHHKREMAVYCSEDITLQNHIDTQRGQPIVEWRYSTHALPLSCVMHSQTYSLDHHINFWTTRMPEAAVAISIPAHYMFLPSLQG